MRKGSIILLLGLLLGSAAFGGFYYLGTSAGRRLMRQPQPELAWLQQEFSLGDAEFSRIVRLHEAYLPKCAERCRRIEEQNVKLQGLLAGTAAFTPEMRQLIAERARLRAECETEMLQHFLEVSRTMPTEQGQRYLAWVQRQVFWQGQGMEQQHHVHEEHGTQGGRNN